LITRIRWAHKSYDATCRSVISVLESVVDTAHVLHSKVHNSGSPPIPGMALAKRIGLPQFGQSILGLKL